MSPDKDPAPEDRKRVEEYVEWRRARGLEQVSRRRRWLRRAGIAMSLGVAGLTLVARLTGGGSRDTLERAPVAPLASAPLAPAPLPPSPQTTAATGLIELPPAQAPRSGTAPRTPRVAARAPQRPAPSDGRVLRSPPPLPDRPSPSVDRAGTPDTAAAGAPPPQPPIPETAPVETTPVPAEVASTPPPDPAPDPRGAPVMTPDNPPPGERPAMAPPPSEPGPQAVAATSLPDGAQRPTCARDADVAETARPLADRARTSAQAVRECVGGWLEGEVQEFRDGVKREVGEFRAGFDKVRRGLRGLGSILRGAD
jgi:hypothetical protein